MPDTAEIPMVVIPVELLRRCLLDAESRRVWLRSHAAGTEAETVNLHLIADLRDALAAH